MANYPCPSTTVRDSYVTLCHIGETSMYLHMPYVAVLHRNMTESQPYIHGEPQLQLLQQEIHLHMLGIVCAAHGTKFRGGNFKHFKTSVGRAR